MVDLMKLKFREIHALMEKKEISSAELTKSALENIYQYNPLLESYISIAGEDELLKQSYDSDKRRMNGSPLSIIDGIPVAVKDNIHSTGFPTTCGSRILANYQPVFDSTAVERIKKSGGIIIGKTNLDEFAMGSTTENSALRKTRNPWDTRRVPGGSSGGSASAVAAGMAPLALGSDTGGSIRQPAAFCGVTGIKPTYGIVSRYGLVAYASSLDQIGPISRDVYGSAALLSIIAGHDNRDSTSLTINSSDYTKTIDTDPGRMRAVYFPEILDKMEPEILRNFRKSLDIMKSAGIEIMEVPFPAIEYVIATYYFIATAEACSNLSRYDGVKYGYRGDRQNNYEEMLLSTRSKGFGSEVKKRILLGNFVLSSGYYDEYYRKAQKTRSYIMREIKKVLTASDFIFMPSTPDTAFRFGEGLDDPLKIYLADVTTVLANLAGLPAISVPSGIVKGMPAGFQIIGGPLSEEKIFQAAHSFEKSLNIDFVPPIEKIEGPDKIFIEISTYSEPQETATAHFSKKKIKDVSASYKNREKNVSCRTLCEDLDKHLNETVTISGWIHRITSLGGIEFYSLRDRTGMTQLIIEGDKPDRKINPETVVEIKGKVTKEERSPYGNIEIKVQSIKILGTAASNPQVPVNIPLANVNLPTILDNRTLSVRNPEILNVFKIQSEIIRLFSEYLRDNDFVEIKTPKIISSGTEGGSNIFEVKYFDRIAFLAQSPQFYKQIMVGSGFERVFEIGPVFRAEKHSTIRHLNEYTSLDLEMGFIKDEQDIIDMQEGLIKHILKGIKYNFNNVLKEFYNVELEIPEDFPRIHFLEALDILSKQGVKDFEDGDLSPEGERVICEYFEKNENSPFVYIIGYPIKKRPMYTMPDERLPGYTRSFDLLYRGLEITTGGQRIHDYEMLKKNIIDFGGNPMSFKYYTDCFKFGMPPHGGLGLGLERITKQMLNLKNIREASLFPRDINRLTP